MKWHTVALVDETRMKSARVSLYFSLLAKSAYISPSPARHASALVDDDAVVATRVHCAHGLHETQVGRLADAGACERARSTFGSIEIEKCLTMRPRSDRQCSESKAVVGREYQAARCECRRPRCRPRGTPAAPHRTAAARRSAAVDAVVVVAVAVAVAASGACLHWRPADSLRQDRRSCRRPCCLLQGSEEDLRLANRRSRFFPDFFVSLPELKLLHYVAAEFKFTGLSHRQADSCTFAPPAP